LLPAAFSPPTAPAGTTTYGNSVGNLWPSGAADSAGNIYAVWSTNSARANTEQNNGAPWTTFDIWLAASHDGGQNFYGPWRVSSGVGTSVFPWIAAGDTGRVDIVWYQSTGVPPPLVADPASPGALTGGSNNMPANSTWNVMFAQSLNANSREPVFTVSQASDHSNHTGSISNGGLTGSSDRSLLDFFEVAIGPDGLANIAYADNGASALHVSYARQNSGPVALTNPSLVTCVHVDPIPAVSRKTHGSAGTFDVNLPLTGDPGIECRTGGADGNHQVVVTFPVSVTVSSAGVTSGTGSVSSVTVAGNQIFVNLTGVTNAQTITITLFGVSDGVNTGNVAVPMSVLLGDTTSSKAVNSSDISQTKAQSGTAANAANFRTDVTVNGLINSSDISTVKSKSGTALP
jgi:hypothetical protein